VHCSRRTGATAFGENRLTRPNEQERVTFFARGALARAPSGQVPGLSTPSSRALHPLRARLQGGSMKFRCIPVDELRPSVFQVLKEVLASSTASLRSAAKDTCQINSWPLIPFSLVFPFNPATCSPTPTLLRLHPPPWYAPL
jgi:hypothetical protein